MTTNLSSNILDLDCESEIEKITQFMRNSLRDKLHRRGLVVAISGGVDSAVCAALCVKAIGANKVYGLLLPERDSHSESQIRGELIVKQLGIDYSIHNIASTLEAIGCYQWRDDAIRKLFPEYAEGWKNKIVITGGLEGGINRFKLIVQSPNGKFKEAELRLKEYLQIVAATNYKQRIRKTIEYFHADRLNYAVVGTPNRLEYDQGFFVKNGDGSADIKPIAHLYKTQVYTLAHHFKLPQVICTATPSTDTYSLPQGQDEFYFGLPYDKMDIALWAYNHSINAEDLAHHMGFSLEMANLVYRDIETKRRTTQYLHAKPELLEDIFTS